MSTFVTRVLARAREIAARCVAAASQAGRQAARRLKPGIVLAAGMAHRLYQRSPRIESLKIKLVAGSLSLAVAILGITYLTLSHTSEEMATRQARKYVRETLSCFSDAIAESVAANDRLQIHLLAKAFLNNGVQAILVADRAGHQLYASRPHLPTEDLATGPDVHSMATGGSLRTASMDGQDFLHATAPVHFGHARVGVIHLWHNKLDLEQGIRSAHAYVYPIFAGGCLFLILLGGTILYAPFSALKRLGIAADRIGSGDFSERVPVNGHDEMASFCQTFNTMADKLAQAHQEIIRKQLETIEAMINAVEAKDAYTQGHCLRVGAYTSQLLKHLDLAADEKFQIETAAVLHDLGKIGVPDHILLKEGRLTPAEMVTIHGHVICGQNILQHIDSLKEAARWVRHHHERWDGCGYPDGLRGKAIPFASRVIAVADAIDALATDRPYRKGFSKKTIIRILRDERGKQFDPEIVDRAISLLEGAASTEDSNRIDCDSTDSSATDSHHEPTNDELLDPLCDPELALDHSRMQLA